MPADASRTLSDSTGGAPGALASGACAAAPAVSGMSFHHVGVAVQSIEAALETYVGVFGFEVASPVVEVPSQRVRVCFVRAGGGLLVELVEGIDERSPAARILARSGPGPYHLCYRVPDLDEAIAALKRHGCRRLRRFEHGAGGRRRFAFMLDPDDQLFELCEEECAI